MTPAQESQLVHDLAAVMERHGWLTRSDWMRACERAGNGYLIDASEDGHQLTDEATERAAEGLAVTLRRLRQPGAATE